MGCGPGGRYPAEGGERGREQEVESGNENVRVSKG